MPAVKQFVLLMQQVCAQDFFKLHINISVALNVFLRRHFLKLLLNWLNIFEDFRLSLYFHSV